MSTMGVNRFSRCMGTMTIPTMLRVVSLPHAYGRARFTSPIYKHWELTDVLSRGLSPEPSAVPFLSLLRKKINSTSSRHDRRQRSQTAQASEGQTPTETAKIIAEIEKRGEHGWPDLEVSDFQHVDFVMHPSADILDKHVEDWLLKHDLQTCFENNEVFEKYLLQKVHRMTLGFYKDASVRKGAWCCYVSHVLFIVDDYMDECADGHKPEVSVPKLLEIFLTVLWSFPQGLRPIVYKVLDYFDHVPEQRRQTEELLDKTCSAAILLPGTEYPHKLSPLGSAFREAWMMGMGESSPEYMHQFGRNFLLCVYGLVNDGMNRGCDKFPTFEAYMENREYSIGTRVWACMGGYMCDAPVPDEVFYSPNVQQLMTESALATRLANDMYSLHQDLKSTGLKLNAVAVMADNLNCSLDEAYTEATKQLFKYIERMMALRSAIEAETPLEHLPNVRKLLGVCFSMFGGCLDYFKTSVRYKYT